MKEKKKRPLAAYLPSGQMIANPGKEFKHEFKGTFFLSESSCDGI